MPNPKFFLGLALETTGVLLGVLGGMSGRIEVIIAGIAIGMVGLVLVIAGIFSMVGRNSRQRGFPDLNGAYYGPDGREEITGSEEHRGTVTSIRNTGTVRGVNQFGTEITIEVDDNGFATRGVILDFLTPAEIASLPPGTEIRVRSLPSRPGQYMLVQEDVETTGSAGR